MRACALVANGAAGEGTRDTREPRRGAMLAAFFRVTSAHSGRREDDVRAEMENVARLRSRGCESRTWRRCVAHRGAAASVATFTVWGPSSTVRVEPLMNPNPQDTHCQRSAKGGSGGRPGARDGDPRKKITSQLPASPRAAR